VETFYHAARSGAAIVRQDWLGAIALTGVERASWLQGMVTNDVEKLRSGEGCYAAHLNAQGRVIAQMIVLADPDQIVLTLERSAIPKLLGDFDRLIVMEDVQASDVSDTEQSFGVVGPHACAVLESWLGASIGLDGLYGHRRLRDCRVVAGVLGYDVWAPQEKSSRVFDAIVQAGATAINRETFEVLRIEEGRPVYGVDIDETTTMPELGDTGISYDKGCYIGQEVVARIKYIGHVNRRFVGFTSETGEIPETRSVVRYQGKDVGTVTSSVSSPGLGKAIALGFANRTAAEPGTRVELVGAARTVPALVTALPFVRAVATAFDAV
jgi:folate-binding protein YgfZ